MYICVSYGYSQASGEILFVMDIDLLSKMVKELILDDDRVVLPGLGCFVAEIVPAYFSDKGYTINPPYRKLYFRSRPDEGDELIDFYARSNDVAYDVAEKIVKTFLAELKSVLHAKKLVVFPGLGRLRATKENNIFFIADEDLDIYPEGFGLEPVSLKTHQETREEVAAAFSNLKSMLQTDSSKSESSVGVVLNYPEVEPVVDVDPVTEPEPVSEQESADVTENLMTPVTEPTSVSEAIHEPDSEPEYGPDPEPVHEPESESVPDTESVTDPESEAVLDLEPVSEAEPDLEPVSESDSVPVTVPDSAPDHNPENGSSGKSKVLKVILAVFVVIAVLVAAYMIVGRLCPEWIDRFLFSPEEIEILNR